MGGSYLGIVVLVAGANSCNGNHWSKLQQVADLSPIVSQLQVGWYVAGANSCNGNYWSKLQQVADLSPIVSQLQEGTPATPLLEFAPTSCRFKFTCWLEAGGTPATPLSEFAGGTPAMPLLEFAPTIY